MAYIGNQPALQYITFAKQTFTADSSTVAFTLDNSVANENELEVFVNNVRQEPGSGKAYTASGTTLTMSEAPNTGDDFYCIYQGRATQTVTPGNGTVSNAHLVDSSVTSAKIANDSVTKDKVSNLMYPAFHVYLNATQTVSNDTFTTVQFNTESLDTDNAYDTSTYRFTPQVAGKYFIYASIAHNPSGSNNITQANIRIRKNGTDITQYQFASSTNPVDEIQLKSQIIVDLNGSTDYIDVQGQQAVSSGTNRFAGSTTLTRTYLGGYRIGD